MPVAVADGRALPVAQHPGNRSPPAAGRRGALPDPRRRLTSSHPSLPHLGLNQARAFTGCSPRRRSRSRSVFGFDFAVKPAARWILRARKNRSSVSALPLPAGPCGRGSPRLAGGMAGGVNLDHLVPEMFAKRLRQRMGVGKPGGAEPALDPQIFYSQPWRDFFHGFKCPYFFYGPDDYEQWLRRCGFEPRRIELIPKDMRHSGKEARRSMVPCCDLDHRSRPTAGVKWQTGRSSGLGASWRCIAILVVASSILGLLNYWDCRASDLALYR